MVRYQLDLPRNGLGALSRMNPFQLMMLVYGRHPVCARVHACTLTRICACVCVRVHACLYAHAACVRTCARSCEAIPANAHAGRGLRPPPVRYRMRDSIPSGMDVRHPAMRPRGAPPFAYCMRLRTHRWLQAIACAALQRERPPPGAGRHGLWYGRDGAHGPVLLSHEMRILQCERADEGVHGDGAVPSVGY